MQPISMMVENVIVYPFIEISYEHGAEVEPVIINASGTYLIDALSPNLSIVLDLTIGERQGKLKVHGKYFARGEVDGGGTFITPWLYCVDAGKLLKFARSGSELGNDSSADPAQRVYL